MIHEFALPITNPTLPKRAALLYNLASVLDGL